MVRQFVNCTKITNKSYIKTPLFLYEIGGEKQVNAKRFGLKKLTVMNDGLDCTEIQRFLRGRINMVRWKGDESRVNKTLEPRGTLPYSPSQFGRLQTKFFFLCCINHPVFHTFGAERHSSCLTKATPFGFEPREYTQSNLTGLRGYQIHDYWYCTTSFGVYYYL